MKDDERDLAFVREQLRSAMPPRDDRALRTDLWPRMLRLIDETQITFGWVEAALAGVIMLTFAVLPDLLPLMLYHL